MCIDLVAADEKNATFKVKKTVIKTHPKMCDFVLFLFFA